jgi:PleD family two-component response regulator
VACDIVLVAMEPGEPFAYDLITKTLAIAGSENTRFIAVLDETDDKGPIESFMAGAVDLLIRPFGAPELRLVIERAIASETIDLRDRRVEIQLEADEMAAALQEQARTGE